ncbi:MAG TPA: lysophospholipid acyltransferase family protein [Terriglobales bacterium]|nr:lysophospholipid acyltransferase family protein [Terriglobales bacterium]
MRERLEYLPLWLLVRMIGALPRPLARAVGIGLARAVSFVHAKLRRVGMRNLEIAFPEKTRRERSALLRQLFIGLGRQLAEFCLFPRYTRENVATVAIYEGFENFESVRGRGKGVLILTGHFGGWEVGSFAHSLYGHPMKIVVRDLDNRLVDGLVKRYRTLHGNETIDNREFARGLLASMRAGETVGILMDTNMTPPQGIFVPYFGVPACTASGLARMALKTGAAVVPGFTLWDGQLGKYKVVFEPALELVQTGDTEADVVANTALFNLALEKQARKHPGQWLWVHRRWKTRPPGEPSLY